MRSKCVRCGWAKRAHHHAFREAGLTVCHRYEPAAPWWLNALVWLARALPGAR